MMQPVVIRLPEEDRKRLEYEAKHLGRPLAEIARRAIKKYLQDKPKQKSGAEVLLKWTKQSKKYTSKYKDMDLSETYKQHLYGPKSKKFGYLWKDRK